MTQTGTYSSKSAYEAFFVGSIKFPAWRRIWWSWTPLRCKFFICLALKGRIWTADRLAKRGLQHPDACPLCDQAQETAQHLLLSCVFTRQIWFFLFQYLNMVVGQDNFRAVLLSCKALHRARVPSIMLKIDIAKAFDFVSWPFLLEVLQQMGFGARWRDWMAAILCTASTKILLNGSPGRRICHARGLRQGDPLSPMLFVLVMEVFNHLINWLHNHELLLSWACLDQDSASACMLTTWFSLWRLWN